MRCRERSAVCSQRPLDERWFGRRRLQIAFLYNNFGINTIDGGGSYTVGPYSGVSGNDLAAGLQLAIWDELANNGTTSGPLSYYGESCGSR